MGLPRINGEVGKLYKDPQLRYTKGGKAVCELPLVFAKRVKTEAGGWEDAGVMWVRGTVWDRVAENVANSLAKGDQVMVSGELSTREYDRQDGSKGFSVELRVWEIAVSLRWNEVKVLRAERLSEQVASGTAPTEDPWSNVPPPDEELPPF